MSPLFTTILLLLFFSLTRFIYKQVCLPYLAYLCFPRQGISGPTWRLISGNVSEYKDIISKAQSKPFPFIHHDVVDRVAPFFSQWIAQFGSPFVYWFGTQPRLVITDPDLVKTVLLDTTWVFGERQNPPLKQLIGNGLPILDLDGNKWANHRRIIAPAFNIERIKAWIPEIATTASSMLDKWEAHGGTCMEFEIEVLKEFELFAADVLSFVAFGSSYEEGKRVFELQNKQIHLVAMAIRSLNFPVFRFIPTKNNQMRWRIEKEIYNSLRKLIEKNGAKCEDSKNLLGLMLEANKAKGQEQLGIEEIIDQCKTFYFAGRVTTTNLLTWAVLLLAAHAEWQHKAREEVTAVCGRDKHPSADDLANLKIVNMILKETLRLYPPATFINRIATRNTKLGKYDIPKGTQLQLALIYIHHDTEIWGKHAHEFNAQRFAEGTSHHLGAYLPFGAGPAMCVGQNLTIVEAKVALAMVLQRFEFEVSPSYVHAPRLFLTLQPQYGAQVLFRKI